MRTFLEPNQTFMVELFNSFEPFTILAIQKSFIIDVRLGYKYASEPCAYSNVMLCI